MKSVFVLTIIGFFSALLLYVTNDITKVPIEKAMERVKVEALRQIFPFEFKNDDIKTVIDESGKEFFEIKGEDNNLKGVAVETSSNEGYSGEIILLLAVSPKGEVFDYSVLAHKETPGLGNKIENEPFKKQFKDKTLDGFNWKVKKDGGFVDELTAATISSRAATDAVKKGLEVVSKKYFSGNKK
ncbi:MAG: RnfABCDGE type electron transport complex subunit G [Elusimicrobiales bacterium]|nr:RnfABCDGE type electron transport complex subunit G [Elusimicrobiales bacterium]